MARPGTTVYGTFLVENTAGQLANADSAPVVTIRRNGVIQPDVITVTNPATGEYAFSFAVPAGWAANDLVLAFAAVVIDGDSYTAAVGEWVLDPPASLVALPTTPNLPGTRDEWRFWPNLEPVTLRVAATAGYTAHDLTHAKRRAVASREVLASAGVYTASDLVWLIPAAVLPSGVAPKPADQVRDADSVDWTILEIQPLGKFGNTWRLVTRSLVLAADLRQTCDVLRPSFAQDTVGQRSPVFAVPYEDVPCRLQETRHDVQDFQGGPNDRREYSLWVGQRLTLRAGDVVEIASVRYDVLGSGDWDRIDRLGEVRVQRIGV